MCLDKFIQYVYTQYTCEVSVYTAWKAHREMGTSNPQYCCWLRFISEMLHPQRRWQPISVQISKRELEMTRKMTKKKDWEKKQAQLVKQDLHYHLKAMGIKWDSGESFAFISFLLFIFNFWLGEGEGLQSWIEIPRTSAKLTLPIILTILILTLLDLFQLI